MGHFSTANLAPDMTSDATFRAWGSAISAKLAAMGLVQTADTGQINWTTVTKPGAATTAAGYEIWRFNDANQASWPIFFKIEYGTGSLVTNPGFFFTVGTGSNGSGTITNANTRIMTNGNASSTLTSVCVFSGDTNRVGFCLWKNLSQAGTCFFLERGKDTSGNDNNQIYLNHFDVNHARFSQVGFPSVWGGSIGDTNLSTPFPDTRTTGATLLGDLAVYSNLFNNPPGYLNAGTLFVGYFNADITADTTFVITIYGSPHTYYALGGTSPLINPHRNNQNTNLRLAMRYE